MNCEEFQQRLVDYLYGELSASDQSHVDRHLAECSGCRILAKSFKDTLLTTRVSLSGPLNEPLPARIHERILSIAQKTAVHGESESPPIPNFFTRIFRTPWFWPVCGVATVGALLVLVRTQIKTDFVPRQWAPRVDQSEVHPLTKESSPVVRPSPQEPPSESPAKIEQPSPLNNRIKMTAKAPPLRAAIQDVDHGLALNSEYKMHPESRGYAKKSLPKSAKLEEAADEAVDYGAAGLQQDGARQTNSVSLEQLQRTAYGHFQSQRWAEAIQAYQDLLRQFPQSKNIAKWRERLNKAISAKAEMQPPMPDALP